MDSTVSPGSEAELVEALRWANATLSPLEVQGSGSKRAMGSRLQTRATLDLSRFSGVSLYEPQELVITAGAATPLSDVTRLLAEKGQAFAFEPPDLSALLGSNHAGTLGGMLACGLSGPRRLKAGAVRDHVLGIAGVSGRAEAFKAGGRVVKNVTGYDLPKLMAGSHGTLAALTSLTFKCLPAPETEETLVLHGLSPDAAVTVMSLALQSPCEISGTAHLPGRTLLRLEGIPPSIAYRRERLKTLLESFGEIDCLEGASSREQWADIRDVKPLADARDRAVWRLSVAPSEGAEVLRKISSQLEARGFLDWGGGLIWLDVPPSEDAGAAIIRAAAAPGHATLIRAPEHLRNAVATFQPQPAALAALSDRVKQAFDPNRILNPGRMA